VQKHAARQLHYDLRLEMDGVLKSWAVPRGPSLDPKEKPLAVLVEDHPVEYGEFEGVIPAGEYGGGTVMLWDRGEWEPIGDPAEGLRRGDLKFRLHGEKLRGEWVLARMKDKVAPDHSGGDGDGGRNWLLIKKRDAEARAIAAYNVLAELPFSVASGRTMDAIAAQPEAVWKDGRAVAAPASAARGASPGPDPSKLPGARPAPLPATFAPQLAGSADAAPPGDDWLHEVKLDGYRLLCRIENGAARLLTRNGHDWTSRFEIIARAATRLPVDQAILDGEVVVLDADGVSNFGALQNAMEGQSRQRLTYFVFDVPHAAGFDLTGVPLLERKTFLEALLRAAPAVLPSIRACEHIRGRGPVVFEESARLGVEGIVSKRVDAKYVSRRSDAWLKVKCRQRDSFVVGGFSAPGAGRPGFGALLLGSYRPDGRLVYRGRVGSGFTDRDLASLAARLEPLRADDPPFLNPEADPEPRAARWVRPEIVVEVEFTGWTHEALLRHAVFLGVRSDVDARSIDVVPAPRAVPGVAASAAPPGPANDSPAAGDALVAGVRISHPGRIVYPEQRVSKRMVAEYYERVAAHVLPHVVKRPLSVVRCPLGVEGEAFYQKTVGDGFPAGIRGTPAGTEAEDPFLAVDDLRGLVGLVQMGVLEVHAWGCREDDLARPDRIVFDLDPGPGITWGDVVASAVVVRNHLERIGMTSFVKTSGGKGVHVVVPIVRRATWDEVKAFAAAIARALANMAPLNFVATMSKQRREQRVFIDYFRNHRGATAVAPYSTRARPGACVSTPLAWSELTADAPPSRYTVLTVPDLVARRDPWEGFFDRRQSITAKMRAAAGM
jgi:bifunctional non-homologous end joining protein LigD